MIETLIVFGVKRRFERRKQTVQFHGDKCGVDHLTFCGAGVDGLAAKFDFRTGGIEVFVFQFAERAAVNGVSVPYRIVARRPGDVASCYADPSKAFEELGWKAVKTLDDMVRDSWMWQLKGAKN